MLNARELYTFLDSFSEMCENHPFCEGCELTAADCLCGCWSGGTVEQVEKIVLAVERWKTVREKEITKRELRKFVERLAEELDGVTRIEDGALAIEGGGAEIRFELRGAK